MTWTYLLPRHAAIVASPAPTASVFTVTTGEGSRLIPGPATVNGYICAIFTVVGDIVTLVQPLTYIPLAGQEVVQTIIGQKDKVRLLVGDTDTTDQQLQDEEIAEFIGLRPNPLRAASLAAEAIAAKLSRAVDYQIYQSMQEKMSDASVAYQRLADRLRKEASRSTTFPYMGGLLVSEKEIAIHDVSHVQPFFRRDMMTEPGTDYHAGDNLGYIQPYY